MRLPDSWLLRLLLLLALALGAGSPAAAAAGADHWLADHLNAWPQWHLPAPLPRPGSRDLIYPNWFAGEWNARLHDPAGQIADREVVVRFVCRADGAVVGDRAFNATAIGRATLGDDLLSVRDDPQNPNRQIALLTGDRRLETSVVGRRQVSPDADTLLADELSLQVLHTGGDPRVSRVETLSRYRRQGVNTIEGEQWQASYASPADGLAAPVLRSWRGELVLTRVRDAPPARPGDPAS